jgi:phosphoglycolate phosphatase
MKYKAVLFDLDGTLLNTLEDIAICANYVLKKNGYPVHDTDKYRHFVGEGMAMLVRKILPETADEATVNKCLDDLKDEYSRNWKNKTVLYPGIRNMLNMLQEKGIRMSVLSNKPHESTLAHVNHFLSGWKFDAVFGTRQGVPIKPDPVGALEISRIMSISPDEFIYAGDTNTDMMTAVAAGMFPAGVLWGFRDADELLQSVAKKLIKKPVDLVELFE